MKKVCFAGVAIAALCSASAFAADMPVKAPVYKAPPPVFSWTGCYGGLDAGGSWGNSESHFDYDGVLGFKSHTDGAPVGGTLGCNWQNGAWVWGVETDLAWTNLKGTGPDLVSSGFSLTTKSDWLNTDRVRFGYAVDRSLWYVTGGVAVRDVKAIENDLSTGVSEASSHTRAGWTVGAGAEFALAYPHWSWKIEYLYADYGNWDNLYSTTGFSPKHVSLTENIVRVGLNYHFDWGKAPVVAKY